jgi:hypothetical protein
MSRYILILVMFTNCALILVELRQLRNCIDHLANHIGEEWNDVEKRNENGEFSEFEDYEAALDLPWFMEDFCARSFILELNIYVENILQERVHSAWNKKRKNGPVWEQQISTVWKLIEENYNIKKSDITNYNIYENLRDMANAFKHRKGFRLFSKIEQNMLDFNNARYKATFTDVKAFIDNIEPFLRHIVMLKENTPTK